MALLPDHGPVECPACHRGQPYTFDKTKTEDGDWRITTNPLAWGNPAPAVLVLGFSKGSTQAGARASQPHDQIAYHGGRANLAKILHHVGLLTATDSRLVDQSISIRSGRFHIASLIQRIIERFVARETYAAKQWKGTGGGMLEKIVARDFGQTVLDNCSIRLLRDLPTQTKLILMLALGTRGNYVTACRQAITKVRPGRWRSISEVTYADDNVVVVHTEHFASQGALPNWLSDERHQRSRLGLLASAGVEVALDQP